MSRIQPKSYMDNFQVRNHAYGTERRKNIAKIKMENAVDFPKSVEYSDIDQEFIKWVEEKIDLTYDGKKFPTINMISNQKIAEYFQTWGHVDETGNIMINFKSVTRDSNPQRGTYFGDNCIIPGHRDYTLFADPVLQENGTEAYDIYSMKMPMPVDFTYKVSVITNKLNILNAANTKVNNEFESIQCFIFPNGHAMPMELEDISDESEYELDTKKYYEQTYTIKLLGLIIQPSDYKVTKVPSRLKCSFNITDPTCTKIKRDSSNDLPVNRDSEYNCERNLGTTTDIILKKKAHAVLKESEMPINKCHQKDENYYYNKSLIYRIIYPSCQNAISFSTEDDFVLDEIITENVYDFKLTVNGEAIKADNGLKLLDKDNISIKIARDNRENDSVVELKGYDPNVVIDSRLNPESELDNNTESEKEIEITYEGNTND